MPLATVADCGASSDDEGDAPQTPTARQRPGIGPEASYSTIPERRKPRKLRRRVGQFGVIEGPRTTDGGAGDGGEADQAGPSASGKRPCTDGEEAPKRTYRRLAEASAKSGGYEAEAALMKMTAGFGEDYFLAPRCAGPSPAAVALAAAASPTADGEHKVAAPEPAADPAARGERWLRLLHLGFSLLVQGVGSKRRLLEGFADDVLEPWGAAIVRMDGFNARFSLCECLRDVLEQLYPGAPRCGAAPESLAAAICAARRVAKAPVRPLCLVVHNLEVLPQPQQAALSSLAASPGVHLVASVDSIWAALAWNPRCLADFNFCREEVHTYEGYEVEAAVRYPGGLPAWADPTAVRQRAPKARLGLVLQSLTNSHRELVQEIAKHQLKAGGHGGISTSRLLSAASDRMICKNVTKLRSLLNELRDHEVVTQRSAADGGMLFQLPCSGTALQRLAEGAAPEDSEEEEEEDSGCEGP